jgi:hypothetical protein
VLAECSSRDPPRPSLRRQGCHPSRRPSFCGERRRISPTLCESGPATQSTPARHLHGPRSHEAWHSPWRLCRGSQADLMRLWVSERSGLCKCAHAGTRPPRGSTGAPRARWPRRGPKPEHRASEVSLGAQNIALRLHHRKISALYQENIRCAWCPGDIGDLSTPLGGASPLCLDGTGAIIFCTLRRGLRQPAPGARETSQESDRQRQDPGSRATPLRRRQVQRGTARYAASFPRDVRQGGSALAATRAGAGSHKPDTTEARSCR